MEREKLILEIEAYGLAVGASPSVVCHRAVGNYHLYRRMRRGGGCDIDTAAKLRAFMRDHPPVAAENCEGAAT